MSSLSDRLDQSLDELGSLVQDILEAARNSGAVTLTRQLKGVERNIAGLERDRTPVPKELRDLRINLITEINAPDNPATAAERLREGLSELVRSLSSYGNGGAGKRAKPISMRIGEEVISLRQWTDVLVNTANWMITNDHELPADGCLGRKLLIADDPSGFPRRYAAPKRLSNGRYIDTHGSGQELVRCSRALLEYAGLPRETLQIESSA